MENFSTPELKEQARTEYLKKYPLTQYGDFYYFTGITKKEYATMSDTLYKVSFTYADNKAAIDYIKLLLKDSEQETIIPEYPINGDVFSKVIIQGNNLKNFKLEDFINVEQIDLPKSITEISVAGCESLSLINIQITKANWTSVSKNSTWNEATGNYVVYCLDGSIAKADDN